MRGSGCRRRGGARLLLAGDNTFGDGLGIIHYCRLGYLLRVVCDEGGRARSRAPPHGRDDHGRGCGLHLYGYIYVGRFPM